MKHFSTLILIGYFSITGCSPIKGTVKYTEVKVGTYEVKITPANDDTTFESKTVTGKEIHKIQCGYTEVIIKDNKIRVNGKLFGIIEPGNTATIDNGEVRVNGEYRFQDLVY